MPTKEGSAAALLRRFSLVDGGELVCFLQMALDLILGVPAGEPEQCLAGSESLHCLLLARRIRRVLFDRVEHVVRVSEHLVMEAGHIRTEPSVRIHRVLRNMFAFKTLPIHACDGKDLFWCHETLLSARTLASPRREDNKRARRVGCYNALYGY